MKTISPEQLEKLILAERIKREDVENLEQLEDGDYKIPEHIIICIKPTVQQKIDALQTEVDRIGAMQEPGDAELLAWAKENHEYYQEQQKAEQYRTDINNYKKQL